jgi:tetratricopeptide (TPR) repeat protein
MRLLILLFAAAQAFHLDVQDARGKKPSGTVVEVGEAGQDSWRKLNIIRARKDSVIVWPFDGLAAEPDGPGAVQVAVIERGDSKALASARIAADIATGIVLGRESLQDAAKRTGFDAAALKAAFTGLATASDDYAGGAGLLWTNQPARAADLLARALRERERQLTRVPSDIFPAAMLEAKALFESGKYDDAAAVYLKAMKLRPSDPDLRKARAEALTKAGKEDAARELLEQPN